jgi:membrane protease YdiL (CAAX protease family)
MLVKLLNKFHQSPQPTATRPRRWLVIALPAWIFVGFMVAEYLTAGIVEVLKAINVPLRTINASLLSTIFAAVVYLLSLVIVIGLPWAVRRYRTNRQELGMTRLPSWMDILLAPAGFVLYLLLSGILVHIAGSLFPGFDMNQQQQTGFNHLSHNYELILAFLTLVVIAPLAEEMLFRGYLYGKLRSVVPVWLAALVTSGLFGALHAQWNVGIDVFALSLVLCSLREVTGNIWAGVLLHMLKNGLAFYLLFINTALLHTIGG